MRSRPAAAVSGRGFSADMELSLHRQLLSLVTSFLLGLGLGLGYDLLRPPRYRGGAFAGALLDVLFSLLAGAAIFLCAMGVGEGRLGLWELCASTLGFLLYFPLFSPMILPLLTQGFRLLCSWIAWCKKVCVRCRISAKKNFQIVRKCFIVKR